MYFSKVLEATTAPFQVTLAPTSAASSIVRVWKTAIISSMAPVSLKAPWNRVWSGMKVTLTKPVFDAIFLITGFSTWNILLYHDWVYCFPDAGVLMSIVNSLLKIFVQLWVTVKSLIRNRSLPSILIPTYEPMPASRIVINPVLFDVLWATGEAHFLRGRRVGMSSTFKPEIFI